MEERPRRPRTISLEVLAQRILEDVSHLVQRILRKEGVLPGLGYEDIVVTIPLEVGIRPTPSEASSFLQEVTRRVKSVVKGLGTFRFGRVYCFQCQKPDCEHSAPADPAEVFCGYATSGRPVFQSFVNLLIERADPRVDLLFSDPPMVASLVMEETELSKDLLSAFSSEDFSYRIRGQVVVGLLPESLTPGARAALTAQVVETRGPGRRKRIRLNVLGLDLDSLYEAGEGPQGITGRALARTLRAVQLQLDAIGRKAWALERRGYPDGVEEALKPLLSRMNSDFERIFRSASRRTKHAQERREKDRRPTSQALRDALEAPDERVVLDTRRDTIVVLGPRGRTHVFTRDGRLVTTLILTPQEVLRRQTQSRWRALTSEEVAKWREVLKS